MQEQYFFRWDMKQYETEQRKILLDFLGKHSDEGLSSVDIINYLGGLGISKSAVYRNLASLEGDGKIRRYVKNGEKTAYYNYVDSDHCRGKIHISCIKCGKTSHISARIADNIVKSIEKEDEFSLDKSETVLYGICKNCKEATS